MRYKVEVSYDGSNYFGFQRQNDVRTIQEEIEKILFRVFKKPTTIYASGRTDARVHADRQVFHFDTNINIEPQNLKRAINSLLPGDIFIREIEEVDPLFHSRYDAISKEYLYLVNVGTYNPLQAKYIFQLERELNIAKMQEAANLFIGKHDFRSFCSNKIEETQDFVREIEKFEIVKVKDIVEFRVKGSGFLRYMVRMMVGTLIEIGLERKDKDIIIERLDVDVKNVIPYNAPASGLYLKRVYYPPIIYNYHTHTSRCLHASGSDEEYVISAIENGFKELGFSDHLMSNNINEDWKMRGEGHEKEQYFESVRSLKEKYKDRINVLLSMECEYVKELEEELKELKTQCDYLVLGLHYLGMKNGKFLEYSGYLKTPSEIKRYGDLAIKAMKTKLFKVFAHPDLFLTSYPKWDETCEEVSLKICKAALKYDVALEVNTKGMFYFEKKEYEDGIRAPYPHINFFKIAKKIGNKIIIGIDAHDPSELTYANYKIGVDFLGKIDAKFISKLDLED